MQVGITIWSSMRKPTAFESHLIIFLSLIFNELCGTVAEEGSMEAYYVPDLSIFFQTDAPKCPQMPPTRDLFDILFHTSDERNCEVACGAV